MSKALFGETYLEGFFFCEGVNLQITLRRFDSENCVYNNLSPTFTGSFVV